MSAWTVTIICQAVVVADSKAEAESYAREILRTETIGCGIRVSAVTYERCPIAWPGHAIPYGTDPQETWATVRRRLAAQGGDDE